MSDYINLDEPWADRDADEYHTGEVGTCARCGCTELWRLLYEHQGKDYCGECFDSVEAEPDQQQRTA